MKRRVVSAFALMSAAMLVASCAPQTPTGPTIPAVGTCFAHANAANDVSYVGGIADLDNVAFYTSTNSTCTGAPLSFATAVWGPTQVAADALCDTRQTEAGAPEDPVWLALSFSEYGFVAPDELWACNNSQTVPPPPPPPPVDVCYTSTGDGSDLGLVGAPGTYENAAFFAADSDCLSGPWFGGYTVVQEADATAALEACQVLSGSFVDAVSLVGAYDGIPGDLYACT